jgi:DNA-binding CsgD family transcriptional regulator/heme-degrading monooxygenase HmoA
MGSGMILRIAHFRVATARADLLAHRTQAMLGRIRRIDGLAWSTVGSQPEADSTLLISVSLWRDRESMVAVLGRDVGGRAQAEAQEELPAASKVEIAEVVDETGSGSLAAGEVSLGRRRRRLLPQDLELLRLLCGGSTLAQAALTLGVSVGTAKNRRHEIYEKLGVHDLTRACALVADELQSREPLAG